MTAIDDPRVAAAVRPGRRSRARRAELAEFLRARRSAITPADVGLPPGLRRRTPGLRREEVAQLAGVGVTWYTWLEQGRGIHVSAQVLDAVARTLRLDEAEREHLYRLAEMPAVPAPAGPPTAPPEIAEILTALNPLPAILLNSRYDVIATNSSYQNMFATWHTVPCVHHNILWCCLLEPTAREQFVNLDDQLRRMVATLRAAFGHHLDDPEWTGFIAELSEASPQFADLWARHEVSRPAVSTKRFRDPVIGELILRSTTLAVGGITESRIVAYTPADEPTRLRLPAVTQPSGRRARVAAIG
jgi:transcriptional regulator with XRE-family HTH domain